MPRYWTVVPDIAVGEMAMAALYEHHPRTIVSANADTVTAQRDRWTNERLDCPDLVRAAPPQTPLRRHLCVTAPHFAPDLIWFGPAIVSARLRAALAQDDHVAWLPLDLAGSTDAILAQDYQELWPLVHHPVLDLDAAGGQWMDMADADGTIRRRWLPPMRQRPDDPAMTVRWRDDVVPAADLFIESHMLWLLATDALKQRVEQAGITDLQFLDYAAVT